MSLFEVRVALALGLAVLPTGFAPAQILGPGAANAAVGDESIATTKRLDADRDDISPTLGASDYFIDGKAIAAQPQGVDTAFEQVLLQAPGVSQDSFGQPDIRDEHVRPLYRLNGVNLLAGSSGLSQVIDPRTVESIDIVTGALPAQYGYRTSGVVDITTKSGASDQGATLDLYGGSYDTLQPSITASGSSGEINYFASASYLRNDIGVGNPTASANPIHDHSAQTHEFAYLSDILSPDARITAMLGSSIGYFQIPGNPGQTAQYSVAGVSGFNLANLNERQREINYYGILALQVSGDKLDYQIAPFSRYSETKFTPDPIGDLVFNGFADRSQLSSWSSGFQGDGKYQPTDDHTIRAGLFYSVEKTISQVTSSVLPIDPLGDQPFTIYDQTGKTGYLYGLYLEDEWAVTDKVTINYGGRFDIVNAYTNENQISPRVNVVWKPDDDTTIHAGYARDFTPPPQELAASQSIDTFIGTTKQPKVLENGPARAERGHYFDVGALRTIIPGLDLGLDTYYKIERDLIDEGQFGESLVQSPFNYRFGRAFGIEATGSYHNGPFGAYANVAYGEERGKDIVSSQFLFSPAELSYIHTHAILTDHDQPWTISGGASYAFTDSLGRLRASLDLLFGDGLRRSPDDAVEPNGEKLPSHTAVNLGLAQDVESSGLFSGVTIRFDVINLFDQVYEIRDGTGVGVGAPQFGQRRGFYSGISKTF